MIIPPKEPGPAGLLIVERQKDRITQPDADRGLDELADRGGQDHVAGR